MINFPRIESINADAPKLLGLLNNQELTEALIYFTTALNEVVDAVFQAHYDPSFLTPAYAEDLKLLQAVARITADTVANNRGDDIFET